MDDTLIPTDYDNRPVIGPAVEAFIKLLAEIAYRPKESEEEGGK